MSEQEKVKALHMRIVELENAVKDLQPPQASFSEADLKAYDRVSSVLGSQVLLRCYKCINECSCGPCNCDRFSLAASLVSMARIAQLSRVLSPESVARLTTELTQNLGA
jgi:hypothetical protein